jgi:hypothetical protein
LRRRGALSVQDFGHVYGVWTGCSRDSNVFLSAKWEDIDMAKIATGSFEEARVRSQKELDEEVL